MALADAQAMLPLKDARPFHIKEIIAILTAETGVDASTVDLATALSRFENIVISVKPNPCPKCAKQGFTTDGLTPATDIRDVEVCQGFGYTETAKRAVICGYEDV